MTTFCPSPEQSAILAWTPAAGRRHLQIVAGAGCGKTTTMVEYIRAQSEFWDQILCVAFNKSIATTLEERTGGAATCSTLNGLGHRALGRFLGRRPTLAKNKVWDVAKQLREDAGIPQDEWEEFGRDVVDLARKARNAGVVVQGSEQGYRVIIPDQADTWQTLGEDMFEPPSMELIGLARELLLRSTARVFANGEIDFDDQIYISALWNCSYQRFHLVMVDETPDLTPLNHLQLAKSIRPGGSLIAVGDPRQAIYGFRGADSNSMRTLAERFRCEKLPLMTTFRCPKAVVTEVNKIEPALVAHENNIEGEVKYLKAWDHSAVPDGAAILCRYNAPVFSLAFKLIAEKRRIRLLGRDFGKTLNRLLESITGKRKNWPVDMFHLKLDAWENSAIAKAEGRGEGLIRDKAQCLRTVSRECEDTNSMAALITSLFEGSAASITLSSIHKSKGLEWHDVFILDRHLVPSKFARGEDAIHQEWNLLLVAETRSMKSLTFVSSEDYVPVSAAAQTEATA